MRALWAALHTDGVRRPHAGRSDRRSRRLPVARGQTPGVPGRTRPASPRLLGSPPPWTPCTQFLEARPASGGDDRVQGAPG